MFRSSQFLALLSFYQANINTENSKYTYDLFFRA